jgi:poly(3-hydroxybutyrate) depolymerase
MTICQRSTALILFSSLSLAVPALAKDSMKSTFRFEGKQRTYYFFAPDKEGPLPLVVLLHGSGRNGLVYKRGCQENTSPSTGRREDFRDIQPLSR